MYISEHTCKDKSVRILLKVTVVISAGEMIWSMS